MEKKTFWDKLFRVVVGLCVVMLFVTIWGVSRQQRRCVEAGVDGPVDVVQGAGWDALVGAGEQKEYVKWEGLTVKPSKEQLKRMAKANITSGTYSGSLDLRWRIPVGSDQGEVESIQAGTAFVQWIGFNDDVGWIFQVQAMSPDPGPTGAALLRVPYPESGYSEVLLRASFVSTDAALEVTHSTTPIGEKGATHAKECVITEVWSDDASSTLCKLELISGGVLGTQGPYSTFIPDERTELTSTASGAFAMQWGIGANLDPDGWGHCGKYALSFENIKFCGETVDLSAATPRVWHETPEGYFDGGVLSGLWLEGTANGTLGLWGPDYQAGPYVMTGWEGGTINAPLSFDFSNIDVKWMDGSSADGVEVVCPAIRVISTQEDVDDGIAAEVGKDMGPWTGTMAELKARGRITQKYGIHSWDTYDPDMSNVVTLYMKYDSMREQGMLDHAKPTIKVEGAMFGVTGTEESYTTSPIDGDYWLAGIHNTKGLYSNGAYFIFALDTDGADWGIGPAQSVPPYYMTIDGGGIYNVYVVNEDDYVDAIIDVETGQKRFSGWSGLGPAVSQQLAPVDPDTSTPSFAHDGTLIFDCWPLDATDRTSAPYMTDVVKLTHSDWTGGDPETVDAAGCPIYKDAHDHTDWVGDGCTVPDAGGNFTVNAPGGTLTLDLRSYYIARQAGTYIPLPNRYWIRKADWYYGDYPTEEPLHEAVYDWRGWSYLKSKFGLPEGLESTDITVTLQYYNDLDGVSDNHMSASERDAGYSYDPGEVLSYTKESSISVVESGEATFITDLYWSEEPLALVKSIKFTFTDTGDYKIYEPALVSDQGDPQTGRVAYVHPVLGFVNHGGMHKFFESPRYAQGGFSSVYDGIFDRQLYIPDNAKANQHEYCFPTLNVVIGQGTGQDLTTSLSLAALPIGSSCEAWVWTHSQSAEDAHMKDADGAVLKTLNAYDIVPIMNGTDAKTAVRCYQITCVRGLPYTFYGTHWVGGAGHGMCKTTGGDRKRGTYPYDDIADLYERPMGSTDEGDYVLAEDDVRADEHGHWHDADGDNGGGAPTTGDQELMEWAVKGKEYVSLGQFYTREYSVADVVYVGGGGVYVVEWKRNMIFVFEHATEGIQHLYTSPPEHYYGGGHDQTGYALPKLDVEETDGSPAGYMDKNAKLYLYHLLDGTLKRLVSTDLGQNWSEATDVITGENISKAIELWQDGISYCLAVNGDGALHCYRSKDHFSDGTWTVGTNKFLIASGVEDVQPGGYFAGDKLYCFIGVGDDRKGYQSGDLGRTWAEITA